MRSYKKKLFISLALIFFSSLESFAQKDTIKGKDVVCIEEPVYDTNGKIIINPKEIDVSIEEDGEMDLYDPPKESDKVFLFVKQMPEFPGGVNALRRWIAEHVNYPNVYREGTILGTVYLRFVVKKDGSIGKIELQKGVDLLLDEEAIKVIKKLPKFKPGEQNGKKVNVWFSIPVTFKLE